MTIRAAFGMFGDRNEMFTYNNIDMDPPFGQNISLGNVNLSNPWASYPGGNPIPALAAANGIVHPSKNAAFPGFGTYFNYPLDNYQPPYTNQWNVSIQRQVGANWLLTANYIGNSQIHLYTSRPGEPAGETKNPVWSLQVPACKTPKQGFLCCAGTQVRVLWQV